MMATRTSKLLEKSKKSAKSSLEQGFLFEKLVQQCLLKVRLRWALLKAS